MSYLGPHPQKCAAYSCISYHTYKKPVERKPHMCNNALMTEVTLEEKLENSEAYVAILRKSRNELRESLRFAQNELARVERRLKRQGDAYYRLTWRNPKSTPEEGETLLLRYDDKGGQAYLATTGKYVNGEWICTGTKVPPSLYPAAWVYRPSKKKLSKHLHARY